MKRAELKIHPLEESLDLALPELESSPLFPKAKSALGKIFKSDSVEIKSSQLKEKPHLNELSFFTLKSSSLSAPLYLGLSRGALLSLFSHFYQIEQEKPPFPIDESIAHEFVGALLDELCLSMQDGALSFFYAPQPQKMDQEVVSYSISFTTQGENPLALELFLFLPLSCLTSYYEKFGNKSQSKEHLYKNINLGVSLTIGKVLLTLKELKSLSEGDGLLLDELTLKPKNEKGTGLLTVQGLPLFEVKIKDHELKVLGSLAKKPQSFQEPSMDDEDIEISLDESHKEDEPLHALSDLSVTVSVELARFNMPLSELLSLREGSIVKTDPIDIAKPLRLLSKGKPFAEGELVQKGDQVFIRILSVVTDGSR